MNNVNGGIEGVLCGFSYGCIAGSKRDPVITKEVTDDKHAGDDAGSWSNKLWPASACGKVNSFTTLRRHLGQIRQWHYANSFHFEDELWRILPKKRIEPYKVIVERDGKERAEELLELFILDLPNLIDLARTARGEAFKETDYPTVDEVRAKFNYQVSFRPIPNTGGLDPLLFQEAIQEINELHARRLQEANQSLIQRFLTPFETLVNQLQEPGHRKMKSVLETISEMCDLIPSLDLNGNEELRALAVSVKEKFANVSPELMKKDEEMSKMVGSTAYAVVAALQNFGNAGARKFSV